MNLLFPSFLSLSVIVVVVVVVVVPAVAPAIARAVVLVPDSVAVVFLVASSVGVAACLYCGRLHVSGAIATRG